MHKIWLIVKREYLTRVRSRGFLLGTLLTPLAFLAFFLFQGLMIGYRGDERQRIVVLDEGAFLKNGIPDEHGILYTKAPAGVTLDSLKQEVRGKKYDGILRLPPLYSLESAEQKVYYYTDESLSPDAETLIKRRIWERIRDYKIVALGLNPDKLEHLDTEVKLDREPIDKADSAGEITTAVAVGISFFLGIIMYMVVLIYGSIVMRSVMEEKTSRIVEVMMSSVKPFQLMLGKIIGSAGVGTTQLVIWAVLNSLIFIAVQAIFGFDTAAVSAQGDLASAAGGMDAEETQGMMAQIMLELGRQNWTYIIISSILYFIGGYFLYASLFAAVGSAVGDDQGESQSLVFPIMIPIILAFLIMTSVVMRSPNSPLAVFASIFPLFSPIVMPGRLAFDPPWWQVALSLVTLFGTAVLFVWIAGRIYRVGILMYGKKASFRELGKWMFYKV